jgi:hypothetical protein
MRDRVRDVYLILVICRLLLEHDVIIHNPSTYAHHESLKAHLGLPAGLVGVPRRADDTLLARVRVRKEIQQLGFIQTTKIAALHVYGCEIRNWRAALVERLG